MPTGTTGGSWVAFDQYIGHDRYNDCLLSQTQRRRAAIAAGSVALFALNLHVAWRLFFVTFTKQLQSNEGSFIAISRVMRNHPADLLWWPMWNLGIPFHHTYFPFLHAVDALVSALAGIHPAQAFHCVTALFYCLGPAAVFWLAPSSRRAQSHNGKLARGGCRPALKPAHPPHARTGNTCDGTVFRD